MIPPSSDMSTPPRSAGATGVGPRRRRLLIGPVLMLLTPLLLVVGVRMPWYEDTYVSYPRGRDVLDGMGVVHRVTENGYVTGTLLLIAFVVAAVLGFAMLVLALTAMLVRLRPSLVSGIAMALIAPGVIVTFGVLIYYFTSGQTPGMQAGVWVYALSFLPALIGTMAIVNRHAAGRRYTANGSGRQT